MRYAPRLFGALVVAAALCAAPGAAAQKVTLVGAPPLAFKFSEIRSARDADSLVALGSLVKIYLVPTELGGDDDSTNIVYVTPDAAEKRAAVVGNVRRRLFRGPGTDTLEIQPEYEGVSIVPRRIRFITGQSGDRRTIEDVVEIW